MVSVIEGFHCSTTMQHHLHQDFIWLFERHINKHRLISRASRPNVGQLKFNLFCIQLLAWAWTKKTCFNSLPFVKHLPLYDCMMSGVLLYGTACDDFYMLVLLEWKWAWKNENQSANTQRASTSIHMVIHMYHTVQSKAKINRETSNIPVLNVNESFSISRSKIGGVRGTIVDLQWQSRTCVSIVIVGGCQG